MKQYSRTSQLLVFSTALALPSCVDPDGEFEEYEDTLEDDLEGDDDSDRIVGGKIVPPGQSRFVAALFKGAVQPNNHSCGGTLIAPRWVVTAAHCVQGVNKAKLRVGVGQVDLKKFNNNNTRKVARVFRHPQYNSNTTNNDIALLYLGAPFNNVVTVPLIKANETKLVAAGKPVTALGWGATNPAGTKYPDRMRTVTVPVVANNKCKAAYAPKDEVTGKMLCAGTPSKDACFGDSGGPLLAKKNGGGLALVGVTSWGPPNACAHATKPGVYARVGALRGWVTGCMAKPNKCSKELK